jgi:hypothetical protein
MINTGLECLRRSDGCRKDDSTGHCKQLLKRYHEWYSPPSICRATVLRRTTKAGYRKTHARNKKCKTTLDWNCYRESLLEKHRRKWEIRGWYSIVSYRNMLYRCETDITGSRDDFDGWLKARNFLIKTPWLLVRKRNIPTERPPLVGEVSANFFG